ncbi:MAG: outer membrane PBP1 activator LpoA protein [Cellvibrionaceae bacterium]|jgi:outer membrane PBP1 activator LpoA protein
MNKLSRDINTLPILLVLISILATACSGTSTKPQQLQLRSAADIDQAISIVEQQMPAEKESRYIEFANQLSELGEIPKALSLLNRIEPSQLNDEQFTRYAVVASYLYSSEQAVFRSERLLSNERLMRLWPTLSIELQQQLHRQKADTYSQLGNATESVKERVLLSRLLSGFLDITENNEFLWQELSKLSIEQLKHQQQETIDPLFNGWCQLALINKANEASLDSKRSQVNRWVSANPNHPASVELPLDLQLLNSLIEMRPRKVALLLPIEGKLAIAGKTIRDGFMAAYYNHSEEYAPSVSVYDTSVEPINTVYDRAVNDGADLIIGPLKKENLAELQQRQLLPVALLGLNYNTDNIDNSLPAGQAIYQFGLSLEDEAIQAAERAWLAGHRRAMILASNADWSQRAAQAFTQRWQDQGGLITVNQSFDKNSNYSDSIKTALSIDASQSRARKLKRLFGSNFEFEPRRRKDIDMIFLIARSSEGQQLKPTLAFHYAGRVPVYATSQIYSPQQSISKNSDLNGIRFTTLPWILEPEKRDTNLIEKNVKVPPNYERLYAMGIDAFRLHDRLQQLAHSPNTSIYGTTGKLRLDLNKRIIREQPWAEIVKGKAKALPYLTKDIGE